MNKQILFFVMTFLFTHLISAQSQWQKGYNEGFQEGYCYNEIGCVSPPATPSVPNVGSNYNSYRDGYNQGFAEGQKTKISDESKRYNQVNRERYKTSKPTFVEPFEPNYELIFQLVELINETAPLRKEAFQQSLQEIILAFNSKNYIKVINMGISTMNNTLYSSPELDYMIGVSYYMLDKKIKAEHHLKSSASKGHQNSRKMLNLMRQERGQIKWSVTGGYEKSSSLTNSIYGGILLDVPVAYSKKWGLLTDFLYSSNGPLIRTNFNDETSFNSLYMNLSGYRILGSGLKAAGGLYSSFSFERETVNFGVIAGLKVDFGSRFYLNGRYMKKFYEGFVVLERNETIIYPDNTIQFGMGINLN